VAAQERVYKGGSGKGGGLPIQVPNQFTGYGHGGNGSNGTGRGSNGQNGYVFIEW